MKNFVGYIRVSTAKQGQQGVSLPEQKDAIARYAERNGIRIVQWFDERVTAAKRGRPVFAQMLGMLRSGKAAGVIIHKIDRSARNLRDWSDLIELSDSGIEVQVASENLDLHSRGGRLSADIQAVVAADYIRNLREEARKGFYGRLKQGLYPLPAPIGYLNRGRGQAKVHDPARAALVRKAFELYGSGRYSLTSLLDEVTKLGLRNRKGRLVTLSGISMLLNNPFYTGLVRIRRTGEMFEGVHAPLIKKSLFDRVQAVLRGKTNARPVVHTFLFRRLIKCDSCKYSLIGETKKGHTYYRCHTRTCPTTGVREEAIHCSVRTTFTLLDLSNEERVYVVRQLAGLAIEWLGDKDAHIKECDVRMGQLEERLRRLTDAYIDRVIEKELFEERKGALYVERKGLQEQRAALEANTRALPDRLRNFLELACRATTLYEMMIPEEKREFLKITTSNRWLIEKYVRVELSNPFWLVANRFQLSNGDPYRDIPRTWDAILPQLVEWAKTSDESVHEAIRALLQCNKGVEDDTKGKGGA